MKVFILFLATELLGIFVTFRLYNIYREESIEPQKVSTSQFIIYFALITVFILFFIRFSKVGRFFRYFFAFIAFLGSVFVFDILFYQSFALLYRVLPGEIILGILSLTAPISFILAGALVSGWLLTQRIWLHNFVIVLAIAGLIGFWGLSFTPLGVILILILFSIYDYIAVYKTQHMIKMAKAMLEQKAIFAFIVPEATEKFTKELKDIKIGKGFMILGGGDVALPLLLASSLVPQGIIKALIIVLFSLLGLFVNHVFFTSQKVRHPIPALPVIALFSILGYLLNLVM